MKFMSGQKTPAKRPLGVPPLPLSSSGLPHRRRPSPLILREGARHGGGRGGAFSSVAAYSGVGGAAMGHRWNLGMTEAAVVRVGRRDVAKLE